MFLAILACTALTAAGCFICYKDDFQHIAMVVLGGFAALFGIVGLIVCCVLAVEWTGSKYKADIVNREYGTDYSREEIFYGSSVIDTIRELDRRRIEINGDIRRQRDPQRDLGKPDNR